MEILLFKFNKRLNSTKIPDDATGVTVQVDVKQNVMGGREGFSKDCFAVTPTFFIRGGLTPDKASCYNYCKAFGRYYFIRNSMVDINNAITLFCEVDALATLKTAIQNTTARVIYSASAGDSSIDDPRNGPKPNATKNSTYANSFDRDADGTFIMTVIGTSTSNNASPFSVAYALQTPITGHNFARAMLNDTFLESLKRWWADCQNFVVALQWTPIEIPSNALDGMQEIMVGQYGTGVQASPIKTRYLITNSTLQIHKRYSDYRQSSKYVEYLLHVPYCGSYKMSADTLKNISSLNCRHIIDLYTGDVAVRIEDSSQQLLLACSGNAYSSLPVASESGIGKNTLAAVGGLVAAGAAVAAGGLAAASTASATSAASLAMREANAIGHFMSAAQSTIGVFGIQWNEVAQGGALSSSVGGLAIPQYELVEIAHDSIYSPGELSSTRGTPLGKNKLLSDLSGYIQTEGASISSDDYSEIVYIANKQLDAGFFLE